MEQFFIRNERRLFFHSHICRIDKDIAFLHTLCWPQSTSLKGLKGEELVKFAVEKEDSFRTNLRYLDIEDVRMVNDALPKDAFHGSYIKEYKLASLLTIVFIIGEVVFELLIP